ncbi:hypothetical protein HN51_037360 [Arachis hypogaea]|uniref:C2H2-type domain-containing protein n=1 Tax=Arachis hypogaea TaxID=3818 RepID=A0A444ZW19_ARAHY|nr:zinc finger protein GIS2-like [Arachis ipaensis]XP_025640775.1 zinc finger protein GIS2-like [Arachis hypogaea]QHO02901.1 Putative transcriptional regulator RABBIT EARS [Arachis hypogaea]RYR18431.1 hypothetical protein Ahy_B03g063057 [Arachis hypogaea]
MEETHHDGTDQDQYSMWMKRKEILKSHIQVAPFGISGNNSSSSSSWEERAFAEDAARILGGCIWPPRSYSCSFCKREFRSAQALGGHMNVHRRDRARLKRSLSPHNHHHHGKNDCKSSLLLGTSHHHHHQSSGENYYQYYSSSFIGTTDNNYKAMSSSKPSSSDSEPKEGKVNAIISSYCNDGDYVETSLCVGYNNSSSSLCGNEESYCKRPKRTNSSMFSSFLKPCSNDRRLQVTLLQSAESFAVPTGTEMEDLDLELRLGKPQKI